MPRLDLSQRIRQLIEQRQQHSDALSTIDQTLTQINALLGGTTSRRGRKPAAVTAAAPPASTPRGRSGKRRHFEITGDQFVLDFVKQRRNPTTREINVAWKREGRGHTADNTLVKLVKEKKLKRKPLVGERGSRYSFA